MRAKQRHVATLAVLIALCIGGAFAWFSEAAQPDTNPDEAKLGKRTPESLPAADEDYFREMDQTASGVVALTPDEIKGRNSWLVWSGGNDRLWDKLSLLTWGHLDFLKILSSGSGVKVSRDERWAKLGVINEPCFEQATGPDPDRFGLWLDKRAPTSADCPPDPFENEAKYGGVKIGSRGKPLPLRPDLPKDGKMPVGSFYGYATGIVGLRLFPNPDFDEAAAKHWDAQKYYNDPTYYNDSKLIKPYRVGMSCAFCHVGPNPLKPPADPEHPQWQNLSSNVGAQYFRLDNVFDWSEEGSNYIWQLFHTARPGTLDTSLVATDNINNPRSMNAMYSLCARMHQAQRYGKETLAGGALNNTQLPSYAGADCSISQLVDLPAVRAPRVLKDGADSVGVVGALNRVYINIGLFSEEWLLHFNPIIGAKPVSPIEISFARKNSNYWLATEQRTLDIAAFFLKTTQPHKLEDAPGGKAYLKADVAQLQRGARVFAESCARCHSSKLPEKTQQLMPDGCSGPHYLDCWNRYWAWTKTPEFKAEMTKIVLDPQFLDDNYLSSEFRIPVTLLKTNACSPLATNALRDNVWDNFSSETYKELPSVGQITVVDPVTGERKPYTMPGGGRGYTRPPSLASAWSTAPFLLNNSIGKFVPDPSVAARMTSFDSSIRQLLWPQTRDKDSKLSGENVGVIDRTTEISYIEMDAGFLPDPVAALGPRLMPWLFDKHNNLSIGPIPEGTPVGLIANLMIRAEEMNSWQAIGHYYSLVSLVLETQWKLSELGPVPKDAAAKETYNANALKVLQPLAGKLMALSKCPDYVVNRGHYFGAGADGETPLTDAQKNDLIEFIKTF